MSAPWCCRKSWAGKRAEGSFFPEHLLTMGNTRGCLQTLLHSLGRASSLSASPFQQVREMRTYRAGFPEITNFLTPRPLLPHGIHGLLQPEGAAAPTLMPAAHTAGGPCKGPLKGRVETVATLSWSAGHPKTGILLRQLGQCCLLATCRGRHSGQKQYRAGLSQGLQSGPSSLVLAHV